MLTQNQSCKVLWINFQRVSNVTSTYYSYPDAYHPAELDAQMPPQWELPRDITTHTVSTTADINCDEFPAEFEVEDMPPSSATLHHHYYDPTLTYDPSVSYGPSMATFDPLHRDSFDPLRRTTPV